jgi:hypothetical protein
MSNTPNKAEERLRRAAARRGQRAVRGRNGLWKFIDARDGRLITGTSDGLGIFTTEEAVGWITKGLVGRKAADTLLDLALATPSCFSPDTYADPGERYFEPKEGAVTEGQLEWLREYAALFGWKVEQRGTRWYFVVDESVPRPSPEEVRDRVKRCSGK